MTNTTEQTAPLPLPTHTQALARFDEVIATLGLAGWKRHRVDTLIRLPLTGNRDDWTIRHHYDHGTWELYFEIDKYWSGGQTHPDARIAKIRMDRALPTINEVLSQLFGRRLHEMTAR